MARPSCGFVSNAHTPNPRLDDCFCLCYDYISWLSYDSSHADLTHEVSCAILNGERDVAATNIVGYSYEMPREELRPLGAFSYAQIRFTV